MPHSSFGIGQYFHPMVLSLRTTVDHRTRPVNLVRARKRVQQVKQIPETGLLPIAQSPPAAHTRAATWLSREHAPGDATAKHKHNAREASAVGQTRATTLGSGDRRREQGFD